MDSSCALVALYQCPVYCSIVWVKLKELVAGTMLLIYIQSIRMGHNVSNLDYRANMLKKEN